MPSQVARRARACYVTSSSSERSRPRDHSTPVKRRTGGAKRALSRRTAPARWRRRRCPCGICTSTAAPQRPGRAESSWLESPGVRELAGFPNGDGVPVPMPVEPRATVSRTEVHAPLCRFRSQGGVDATDLEATGAVDHVLGRFRLTWPLGRIRAVARAGQTLSTRHRRRSWPRTSSPPLLAEGRRRRMGSKPPTGRCFRWRMIQEAVTFAHVVEEHLDGARWWEAAGRAFMDDVRPMATGSRAPEGGR